MDSEKILYFKFLESMGIKYNELHAYQKLLLDKAYNRYAKRGNS